METINFGNLMDWGQVVEKLKELKKEKRLDDCQEEFIRVLRYPNNWRLREMVLEYIKDVQNPIDDLLLCTLNIMIDNKIYYDYRILATKRAIHYKHFYRLITSALDFSQNHVRLTNTNFITFPPHILQ